MTAKLKKTQRKRKTIQNANFSSLTHLKAALVGWMLVGATKKGWGREFAVKSQKPVPIFSSQFALLYKVRRRKRPNQRQNRQLLLSGFLKRELPWQTGACQGDTKGGESASVLSIWVLPVSRLAASRGGRGLPWSCPLGAVPVILAWRGSGKKIDTSIIQHF